MIKIEVMCGEQFNASWQTKSFKDEMAAFEWCRRNHEKICCINDHWTGFKLIGHFELMDAIRGR